jgi:hypothetical protein
MTGILSPPGRLFRMWLIGRLLVILSSFAQPVAWSDDGHNGRPWRLGHRPH